MAFVTPAVGHWLEWEIAQWVHHEGSIRRPIAPWVNALTTELHLAPESWKTLIKLFRVGGGGGNHFSKYIILRGIHIHIAYTIQLFYCVGKDWLNNENNK